MDEKQTDTAKVTTQLKMPPATILWGYLWIVVCVTAVARAMNYVQDMLFEPFIGGIIGGIVVGLIPWYWHWLPIRRVGWWVLNIINIALIVLTTRGWVGFYFFAIPAFVESLLVMVITRWVYHRRDIWWAWILAVILIVVSAFIGMILYFISVFIFMGNQFNQ
jgi:hypothetical protein